MYGRERETRSRTGIGREGGRKEERGKEGDRQGEIRKKQGGIEIREKLRQGRLETSREGGEEEGEPGRKMMAGGWQGGREGGSE